MSRCFLFCDFLHMGYCISKSPALKRKFPDKGGDQSDKEIFMHMSCLVVMFHNLTNFLKIKLCNFGGITRL